MLPSKPRSKLIQCKNPHTEIWGEPGSSLVSWSAVLHSGVACLPITLFFVFVHAFAACLTGAGERISRDHERAAIGKRRSGRRGQPLRNRFRRGFAGLAVLFTLCGTTPALAQGRCTMPVARVVEAVGFVTVPGPQIINIAAGSQLDICAGETVATGPRSRATVALIASNQHVRINQNTTIRIVAEMPQAPRSVIELLQGIIRLFNPIGRQLDVRTPFVTAGTEGTEFFVAYDPQTEETRAGVIEGLVRVTRSGDSLLLDAGQAAVAPRVGPLQRLDIVPADAVRWSIFYPPAVWTLPTAEEMALDPRVARAWQAWRNGNLQALATELNSVPQIQPPPAAAPFDARSLVRFAALLLIVGQVEEGEAALAHAELANATAPLIPALRSVIAVARNRTDEALTLSERAVLASRQGNDQAAAIGAAIARSYALQSAFRLPEAREILETVESADDPLVFARLAEFDLSLGNNRAARREAQRANQLAPSLSLTSSIVGFAALANFDFAAARTAFEQAAAQNPGDPLPHLGLGLVAIRSGPLLSFGSRNLEEGRRELVIAVALDPENSVARSYAGRTYAELRLYPDAFREWALAEAADPNDPTAPLYRAFAERALNRPTEALRDIERSIALNDNRAVYRSRLLLDQDLATRTTDLASVYRDLNFEQLALSEGYKSVSLDPANPGAHRFLSDTYLALPRHETASDSELLQSVLLQPLNVQPLRPRLAREGLGILDLGGPSRIGFNEFSPVFASNGLSVLADAFGGTQGTYGDNFVLSGIHDRFSFSVGQFYYRTEGIRDNNQLQRNIENALVQVALSDRASLFAEYRQSKLTSGDVGFFFDPSNFSTLSTVTEESSQYRLGGRFDVAPGFMLVGVWTRQDFASGLDIAGFDFSLDTETRGDLGEIALYVSRPQFSIVAGAGYFDGRPSALLTLGGTPFIDDEWDVTHANAWGYVTISAIENIRLTLGASYDRFRSDTSLTFEPDQDQLSPKVGVTWEIAPGSILRAAYFEGLKRTLVGGQTIEPTQIAGFNQLYDDDNSTEAKRWGVGFDQRFGDRFFAGVEWSQRRLEVPILGIEPEIQHWEEDLARSYLNWIISDRFSASLALQWERLVRDPYIDFFADMDITRVPLEVRYFDPSGLSAFVRTSFVYQSGDFLDVMTYELYSDRESFVVFDAGIGWRIPGRPIIGTLLVKNLFNTGFRFQDSDPTHPAFVPRRLLLARLTFSF